MLHPEEEEVATLWVVASLSLVFGREAAVAPEEPVLMVTRGGSLWQVAVLDSTRAAAAATATSAARKPDADSRIDC